MMQVAFEDVYVSIQDCDGTEWADKLRRKMTDPSNTYEALTEQTWLLDANGTVPDVPTLRQVHDGTSSTRTGKWLRWGN